MENIKVLLIDDDSSGIDLMTELLKKKRFKFTIAENSKTGMEIFKKDRPEIVITDYKMPPINGLNVMHTIKRIAPQTQVIIIT